MCGGVGKGPRGLTPMGKGRKRNQAAGRSQTMTEPATPAQSWVVLNRCKRSETVYFTLDLPEPRVDLCTETGL